MSGTSKRSALLRQLNLLLSTTVVNFIVWASLGSKLILHKSNLFRYASEIFSSKFYLSFEKKKKRQNVRLSSL